MSAPPPENPPITGLEVVGRGVYVRPRQPYSLRRVLFPRVVEETYSSRETGQQYTVYEGYAVNDSPPMPGQRALNQVMIEESWGRFDKRMSVDVSVTVGGGPVSIDANAGQLSAMRAEEDAYYAVRSSCVPLWAVYLPDTTLLPADTFDLDVPVPFAHAHRRAYDRFFERFGTHYVRRAWVGGQASVVFSVTKSKQITKSEIQSALTASYGGKVSAKANEDRERLLSNSNCTVLGKGGDELALAALSSLDEARYNAWLATIKDNPQVIEIEVVGIWTLIEDEAKATALMEAYREAFGFSMISSVFDHGQTIYFLRGDEYFTYDLEHDRSTRARPIAERWPALRAVGFERTDAAFLVRPDRKKPPVLYLFRQGRYVQFDLESGEVAPGYPRPIADGWPGVGFDRVDAALTIDSRTAYFFRGDEYIRFDSSSRCAPTKGIRSRSRSGGWASTTSGSTPPSTGATPRSTSSWATSTCAMTWSPIAPIRASRSIWWVAMSRTGGSSIER